MKILRNLVVAGVLYQGDGDVEAVVGDRIILYLDEAYNPDFPESVTGEIVSISKIRCGSSTSYDIEYNEADLGDIGVSLLRPDYVINYLVITENAAFTLALEAEIAARIAGDAAEAVVRAAADAVLQDLIDNFAIPVLELDEVPVDSSITGGTYAEGEYDFDGVVPTDGYVRYMQGQAFTWRNAPSGQYEIGTESPSFPTAEASAFANKVNNSSFGSTVNASVAGTKVTLTAIFTGEIYNDNVGIGALGVMSGGTDGETVAGTPATAIGQLAIVTTTNPSGTFKDVWTATSLSTWQPPGQITRSSDGTLFRAIVYNDGTPSIELAYP